MQQTLMIKMLPTLFLISSILFASTSNAAQDFCVADLGGPATPVGYACKAPADVTVDDFVFSGLGSPANTSSIAKAGLSSAVVAKFPGLNGQGISGARVDLAPGGFLPMHSHPGISEFVLVMEGKVTSGFISTNNKVYVKTLNKGDSMIIPTGLLHFAVNAADANSVALAFLSSENPSVQTASFGFFGNDLPTEIVATTTFLDAATVKKMKGLFGGSG